MEYMTSVESRVQYKNCGTDKLWECYVYFVESMLIYIHNISTTRPQTIYSHTLSYFKLLMFSWNYFDLPLPHFNYSPTNRLLPINIWFQTSISSYNGSSPSLCERGRKRETSGWLPWSYDGHENRAPYLQWQNRAPCFQWHPWDNVTVTLQLAYCVTVSRHFLFLIRYKIIIEQPKVEFSLTWN